jgi:hypothetical protein
VRLTLTYADGSSATMESSSSFASCSPGSAANIVNETCEACAPGSYASSAVSAARRSCQKCERNFFATTPGSSQCTACPLHAVTSVLGSVNRTECVCPPGFYGAAGEPCTPCPPGGRCPGGEGAYPLPGYWGNPSYLQEFFACPLSSQCLGDFQCASGVDPKSRLCSRCSYGFEKVRGISRQRHTHMRCADDSGCKHTRTCTCCLCSVTTCVSSVRTLVYLQYRLFLWVSLAVAS